MSAPNPNHTHMPTVDAYDLWSAVYDTDGNVLQQLDDIYIAIHLPPLLPKTSSTPLVIELGCGTGRNTLKLASLGARVMAVDNSQGMLNKLNQKLVDRSLTDRVSVYLQDLTTFPNGPNGEPSKFKTALESLPKAAGVVSTLVIEHLELDPFFSIVDEVLSSEGWVLLTNMHAEMGALSSAGFLDPTTGKKVKPVSFNHTQEDILSAARRYGFRLDGEVRGDGPRDLEHAKQFGKRAEKWVGVKMHLGMVLRRAAQ